MTRRAERWRRLAASRGAQALLSALALALAMLAFGFALRGVDLAGLAQALLHQRPSRVAAALALTAASFACLAAYDAVAVRLVAGRRVPMRLALLAGATGSAIANTVGFHAMSGTAVRAHLYLPAGLRLAELARVVSLSWLSLVAGNVAMLAAAELVQATSGQPFAMHLAIGLALSAALVLWLAWLATGRRQLALRRHRLAMPPARLALALLALGAIESATAIGALYVLLPHDLTPPFALFAAGCIAAVALGVVAHAPGGLGVFEAGMIALLGGAGRHDLVAALMLYRIVYNLLPFALAALVLGLRRWRANASADDRRVQGASSA